MRYSTFVCLALAGSTLFAGDDPGKVRTYLLNRGVTNYSPNDVVFSVENGEMKLVGWGIKSVSRPTKEELAAITDVDVGYAAKEDVVSDLVTGMPRIKTAAEKQAVVEAMVPVELKKLYSRYIRICHDVLVIAGDPRASQLPRVTLSLSDLYAVMEAADSKNAEKQLNKVSRQLIPVLIQLSADPKWEASIFESNAGE